MIPILLILCIISISAHAQRSATVKWRYNIDNSISTSPAIGKNGTIYIGSNGRYSYYNYLYAISSKGKRVWRCSINGKIISSPMIDEQGIIYVGSDNNRLYAITASGDIKWQYKTEGNVYSSPALGPDRSIYFGSSDNHLYSVNTSGKLNWKYKTNGSVTSSPAVGNDGTIYFGSDDTYLYAITPDGELKWRFKTSEKIASSPALDKDGTLYFGSNDGIIYSLDSEGKMLWYFNTGSTIESSPVIGNDGTIYIGSSNSYVYAFLPTGTLKWKYQTGKAIKTAPAISENNIIYVGSWDDYLYALSSEGELLWKEYLTNSGLSSPNIGRDGTVYIGTLNGYLYAFSEKNGGLANSPWPKFGKNQSNQASNFDPLMPLAEIQTPQFQYTKNGVEIFKSKIINQADSAILSYSWSIIEMPAENSAEIIDSDSTDCKFRLTNKGIYKIGLKVSDNQGRGSTAQKEFFYGLKWQYDINEKITCPPAMDAEGNLYVGTEEGKLYAFDPFGILKWQKAIADDALISIVIGNHRTIYVGSNTYNSGNLYAITTESNLRWHYQFEEAITTSIVLAQDSTIYVGSSDNISSSSYSSNHYLNAITPDGKLKRSLHIDGNIYTPAISQDGTLYFGSYDKYLYAIDSEGKRRSRHFISLNMTSAPAIDMDGTIYICAWNSYRANTSSCLYAFHQDGNVKWKKQFYNTELENAPSIDSKGTIYIGSEDDILYALSPEGIEKWRYRSAGKINGTAAIDADNTVYFGSGDKTLYALNHYGELKWQYPIGEVLSPVIGIDGTLYVCTTDGKVMSFQTDAMGPSLGGWPMLGKNGRRTACKDDPVIEILSNKRWFVTGEPIHIKSGKIQDMFNRQLIFNWNAVSTLSDQSKFAFTDSSNQATTLRIKKGLPGIYQVQLTASDQIDRTGSSSLSLAYGIDTPLKMRMLFLNMIWGIK
ncbi:PQQ-binding-like beta-propeller repeat protein [bacterium]